MSMVNKADGGIILPPSMAGGVLNDSPDVNVMSPVFTITGRGSVVAQSKAPPYPFTPTMSPSIDAQGNYKLIVRTAAMPRDFLIWEMSYIFLEHSKLTCS